LICACALALIFAPATYAVDGCSAASFKVATRIDLQSTPFSIVVADFNTDGHLDLAASPSNGSREVIVLLGKGGTDKFGPPTSFPAGGDPLRMAAGDFNGDGKPDLAVSLDSFSVSPAHRLSILLNDGTGKFAAPIPIDLLGDPTLPVVGDINNDGKLDIVTALFTGSNAAPVAVLLGNGSGGFTNAPNSPFSTFSVDAGAVVIGDFNEDGKRDLALPGTSSGLVDILLGDGAGGFTPTPSINAGGFGFTLTGADFNGDGHLDLLSIDRMLLGNGNGAFAAPITVPLPENVSASFAGDVNGDNHLDVLAAGPGGTTIMLGDGAGNLVRGKSYTAGFTIFGGLSSFGGLGDFNEDGKVDIAAVQNLGIGILDGDGTGAFHGALRYESNGPDPREMVVADFNNDGKQDFATIAPSLLGNDFGGSRVEVALGDGNGGFTRKSISSFGTVSRVAGIATADFNNDGKFDLAVTRQADRRITILINDGTGGFPTNGTSAPDFAVNFQPSVIRTGDFNNDNKADLIAATQSSTNYVVLLGNGSGGFTIVNDPPFSGTNSFFEDISIADFNADGKSDFAIGRSDTSLIRVFLGDGTGQFTPTFTLTLLDLPVALVAKDLNGDNKPDIAVTTLGAQALNVFINNGSGFQPRVTYESETAGMIAVGDFNNDNQPDLAISGGAGLVNNDVDGISVFTNKGNGEFNTPITISAGVRSSHAAVGDFNGDSKADVLISEPGAYTVGVLLNNFTAAQPCLSVNDATVTEVDAGTNNATFTVTLSAVSAQTVRANYFVKPGSGASPATKGADFENVSGTVTFAPGETTQTINIPVKGDLTDEPDQFFFVVLTTPINAVISDAKGLGTIVDNDAPATISINDVTVVEATNFPQSSATFTVSLNAPSEKPITVQFSHEPGTATSADYSGFSGTVEFPVGTASKQIFISITMDNVFEPDETFFINLSNPSNATIADGQGKATITNDDPQPAITIGSSNRAEGAAGTSGNSTFQVTLSNPSYQTITVAYATANGTATAGSDYTATSGTVTFNPGDTTKSIAVEVLGDNVDETAETYVVNLSSPTNATISTAQGTGTILDDDGPTISIGNASVVEGNPGSQNNAVFTVTLSAPTVESVAVNYTTADVTANNGIDYQRVFSNTLVIPAGATTGTLNVRVFGDFAIEADETFTVSLQFASNATIAPGQGTGTGTIVNDDSNGKLQFSSAAFSAVESAGGVVVTISRVEGATGTVKVDFATSDGTAVAGSDYPATTGTVTFNQGEISKAIFITFVNDNVLEGDEALNLTLSNPTGGAILGTPVTAALTIKALPLLLALEESAADPNQVAALDSLLFLRDPFSVLRPFDVFNQGPDRNTRLVVYVSNLRFAQGDASSSVKINLVDANGQPFEVGAEDVRALPLVSFMQVQFRLPDTLAPGVCNIKIKANDQESNVGTMRIKP
jgi:hypothetical protein